MPSKLNSAYYTLVLLFIPILTYSQTTVMLTPNKDNSIYDESTNSNALGDLFAGRNGGGDVG